MTDQDILSAARAGVLMFTMLISREGLSEKEKSKLETTYLRNQGYKLVSAFDLWLCPDGVTKLVKQQALINCYELAVKAVSEPIIKDMQHQEKILLGLLPAEGS